MADLENGPSWKDEFDDGYMGTGACPMHGEKDIVDTRSSGGPDPYQIEELACGCEVIDLGDGPEVI